MDRETLNVKLIPVVEADFELLAELRVAAMRESLQQLGRFDVTRARERLRQNFTSEHTRFIVFDEQRVGFYAARPSNEGLRLDHFYIHPDFQGRGIGGVVLRKILAEADRDGTPILLGALKESASNRFYQRYGFTKTHESDWDIYYMRTPLGLRTNAAPPK